MKRLEAGLNIFCDTNIILRWLITDFDNHTLVYQTVQRLLDWQVELWISPQIIREFCMTTTRPQSFMRPLSAKQASEQATLILRAFRVAEETYTVTHNLLRLMQNVEVGGKQIHDANIVATMQTYRASHLLTLNGSDFRRYSPNIYILDPAQLDER